MDSQKWDKIINGLAAASTLGSLIGSTFVLYNLFSDSSDKRASQNAADALELHKTRSAPGAQTHIQNFETSFVDDLHENVDHLTTNSIFKICISGGPKSGVTTAISKLGENLTSLGYKVFIVPNCWTMTTAAGATLFDKNLSKEDKLKTLICFLRMVMKVEDYFLDIAHDEVGRNSVVLYNGGTMNVKARIEPGLWEAMLAETGWSEVTLRDKRYDMVMHLVTAAEGSEEAYEDSEYTIEQAIKIDHAISECWNGHSKFVMAKNIKGKNFRDKIQYCITSVNSFIGLPTKNKYYQKYLLDCDDPKKIIFPEDVKVERHQLTEIFLKSSREEVQIRISKRSQNGVNRFVYSVRGPSKTHGERMEMMKQMGAQEYMEYKPFMIPESKELEKEVYAFIHDDTSYQIEHFIAEKILILRVEGNQEFKKEDIPEFLKVKEDITENQKYFSYYIAVNHQKTDN